jgi:hypothetical protein
VPLKSSRCAHSAKLMDAVSRLGVPYFAINREICRRWKVAVTVTVKLAATAVRLAASSEWMARSGTGWHARVREGAL